MSRKSVHKENQVKPKEFVVEPPTLTCLGFEWYIEGDDNRNATVEVWYREKGKVSGKRHCLFFAFRTKKAYLLPSNQDN